MTTERVPIGDGLTLDRARGCLIRGDESIHLRPQSYEVLRFLVEQRGRLVTKDALVARVWEGRAVGDGSLGKCIEEVREALGPARPRLRTVWGRGYILEPAGMAPPAPADLPESSRVASIAAGSPAVRARHWLSGGRYVVAATVVLVVATIGLWRYLAASFEPVTSVAVLPFVNASGAADLEHLSDGVSETVIDRLSRISQLRVIASSSSFKYRSADTDPRIVSTALDVSAIVTGRVAIRGDRVHVTAELVDGRTRARLWGDRYSRDLSDLHSIQASMADYSAIPRKEDFSRAKSAALRALTIDETLAEAHTSLALLLWVEGDLAGAEREFRRAIQLNPGYATAHHWYGNYLRQQKRPDEAMAELRRALAIDPLSMIINTALGAHHYHAGEYDKAIAQLEATIDLDPTFPNAHEFLGDAYLQAGRPDAAVASFEKAVELSARGEIHLGKLGHAYAVAGRTAEAQSILAELLDLRQRSAISATNIALVYAGLGDRDSAFAWFESALREQDTRLSILRDRRLAGLRSDPRFASLVERGGLQR